MDMLDGVVMDGRKVEEEERKVRARVKAEAAAESASVWSVPEYSTVHELQVERGLRMDRSTLQGLFKFWPRMYFLKCERHKTLLRRACKTETWGLFVEWPFRADVDSMLSLVEPAMKLALQYVFLHASKKVKRKMSLVRACRPCKSTGTSRMCGLWFRLPCTASAIHMMQMLTAMRSKLPAIRVVGEGYPDTPAHEHVGAVVTTPHGRTFRSVGAAWVERGVDAVWPSH